MTIIAAQMIGTRNGRMIQSEATISVTMNSTPNVICARSRRIGDPPGTMGCIGTPSAARQRARVDEFTHPAAAGGAPGPGEARSTVL